MRILFISDQFPFPLHGGGNLRTYHVLRALAKYHDVSLVAHEPLTESDDAIRKIENLCHVTVAKRFPRLRRAAQNAWAIGIANPLFILRNWSASLLEKADGHIANHTTDAIHFNMLDTACFVTERNWRHPKVFDTHNCLYSMAEQAQATATDALRRSLFRREARLLRRCEQQVCRRMSATLLCSTNDEGHFRTIAPDANYRVAPNGVDTSFFSPAPGDDEEPFSLMFAGAMDYAPNVDAAIYLVERILPLLRKKYPNVRCTIVGHSAKPRIRAFHDGRSIFVTGRVPDVRPYLRKAQVVVVPLLQGGGTRLKILEAFAMGKPVVSTAKGIEGIPANSGEHYLHADTPHEFFAQIDRLFASTTARKSISDNARAYAAENYDWSTTLEPILSTYHDLNEINPSVASALTS